MTFVRPAVRTHSLWWKGTNPHHGQLAGGVSEEPVMEKQKKGWRMSCDVGEAMGGLENEL